MNEDTIIQRRVIVKKTVPVGEYNEIRKKYEQLCKYYEGTISSILSDINILKTIKSNSDKMDGLISISPYFFQNACVNSWFAIIVKLSKIFKDDDTNLTKLLNLIEQNPRKIYITDYYYASVRDGETVSEDSNKWKKKSRDDLQIKIEEAREEIESCAEALLKIKDVRDRLFAHFDKKMLDPDSKVAILANIDINLVESLAKTAEKIYRSIAYFDAFEVIYCTNIDSSDILKLASACNLYCEHKTKIIKSSLENE